MALNLHLLRLFATVAELGSFSRAADALRISQPAISNGVRDFELQVGCRLLDRGPKGVRPTRDGESLLRHARVVFSAERAAEEELRALRGLDHGTLRVGASTTIATYILPRYLGSFHRTYPGIALNIVSANTRGIAGLLAEHAIDVALVEGPVDDPGLVAERWLTDEMMLIASPEHPFAHGSEPVEPERLRDEIFLEREPGSGSREVVCEALRMRGISPACRLEIGSTEAIKQMVAGGLGVAMTSVAAIRDQVALGTLHVVTLRDMRVERGLWRLCVPGRLKSPAATAFEKLVVL